MTDNVRIHYSSSKNITFNGVIETCVSREEWAEFTDKEKNNYLTEELCELVDLWVEDE